MSREPPGTRERTDKLREALFVLERRTRHDAWIHTGIGYFQCRCSCGLVGVDRLGWLAAVRDVEFHTDRPFDPDVQARADSTRIAS